MSAHSELRELVTRLRRDCPWDRAQSLRSMRPFLLEECFELVEALDADDPARVREELGDLLFVLNFVAELHAERGEFDLEDSARDIIAKMVARHPHVFGDAAAEPDASATARSWEARKAASGRSRIDGVPAPLPSLLRAHRVAEKAGSVGFDWPDLASVLAKVDEERAELEEAIASGDPAKIEHEYGDVLLAMANVGRFLGVSGEDALRAANARFERRFRGVERQARAEGRELADVGAEQLEQWWQVAKAEDAKP